MDWLINYWESILTILMGIGVLLIWLDTNKWWARVYELEEQIETLEKELNIPKKVKALPPPDDDYHNYDPHESDVVYRGYMK